MEQRSGKPRFSKENRTKVEAYKKKLAELNDVNAEGEALNALQKILEERQKRLERELASLGRDLEPVELKELVRQKVLVKSVLG